MSTTPLAETVAAKQSGAERPAAERLLDLRLDGLFAESHADEDAGELRARLDRDGYLFMRSLVPPEILTGVRRDILALCAEHGWLAPEAPRMDGVYSGRPFPDYGAEYMPLYRKLIALESFNACSLSPAIIGLFTRLLGGEILAHPRNIARISFPRHYEHTTQPHQDFYYIGGTPETYTTWIPIGDCPRELGGLAILDASHREGLRGHVPTIGAGGHGVRAAGRWLGADYRIGDAVIFHSYTVHGALDNHSPDRLRLSLDYRYQRADLPVDPGSLQPHGG